MDTIIEWKENNNKKKKALLFKGLRQIEKTFIVDEFADKYYENNIYTYI